MAIIRKVTDPKKIVTDPELLRDLVRQGIDKDYVEFHEDYTTEHPSAKFYRDLKSGKQLMVICGLPRVEDAGRKIEAGWSAEKDRYRAKANLVSAVVEGTEVQVSVKLGKASWNPQLFLNSVEQSCGKAILLETDPDNEYYQNNVLGWDYGICKRRLRLIEGAILEKYIFNADPQGELVIKSNWQGELKPSGYYAVDATGRSLPFLAIDDIKDIPTSSFANAVYPVEVDDTLTAYSTSSDGYIAADDPAWADVHGGQCGVDIETCNTMATAEILCPYTGATATPHYWIYRGFLYFDTSSLGAEATISAATLSLYGNQADETDATHGDLGIVDGVQGDPFDTGDHYDHLSKTTLGADSYYDNDTFSTSGYNDKALNATGRGWINKTGTTLFCLRVKGDIDNLTPTGDNRCYPWANEKGTGYQPKLVITYTATVEKTSSDGGSGSETLLSRAYALPEVGAGSESLGPRLLGAMEEGGGGETLLARLLAGAETASGLDASGLIFLSSDVGLGSDTVLALEALLAGDDSSSGIDTSFLIKVLLSSDSGLGTEAMAGSDSFTVKIETAPGERHETTPGG